MINICRLCEFSTHDYNSVDGILFCNHCIKIVMRSINEEMRENDEYWNLYYKTFNKLIKKEVIKLSEK